MKFFMAAMFYVVATIPNVMLWGITLYVLSNEGSETAAGWACSAALVSGLTAIFFGMVADT